MVKSGAHLGVIHSWIQWNCLRGDYVTWGSTTELTPRHLSCYDLEALAQDIRDATLREFRVKDNDHKYKFVVFCDGNCVAFQNADTAEEAWKCLYNADGKVTIYECKDDGHLGDHVFNGTADGAREWVRGEGRKVMNVRKEDGLFFVAK